MRLFLAILLLGGTSFSQEAKVRADEMPPWPPEKGTVKFVVDPAPLAPTMANKQPLNRLCELSDVVAEGIVTTAFPSRSPSARTLETDFLISVTRVLKGPAKLRQLIVSQRGGSIGAFHLVTDQYALMQPAEQYFLFLQSDTRPSTPRRPGGPAFIITQIWSGLGRIMDGKLHLGSTARGDLTIYDGIAVGDLEKAVSSLIPR